MALRAHCTKSFAIIASVFFGFSSAVSNADADITYDNGPISDTPGYNPGFASDNPYEPVDDHQIWRDQIIELLKRLRLYAGTQVTATTTAVPVNSGATTQDVLHESEQLQFEYATYGLKQGLTPSEIDDLTADLVGSLQLLDEDPGVLLPDQHNALRDTLNAMLAEVSN